MAAISTINPIIYAGNYYPYVTVYDKNLSRLEAEQNNNIMGSTNPLFVKLFSGIQQIWVSEGNKPSRKNDKNISLDKFFHSLKMVTPKSLENLLKESNNEVKAIN